MRQVAAGDPDRRTGAAPFDVRLEVADGTARLHLAGPFVAATAGRVEAALQLVSVARATVVVDLVGVTDMDAAALGLLASARRAARAEGWKLSVAGAAGLGRAAQPGGVPPPSRTMVTNRTSNPARS